MQDIAGINLNFDIPKWLKILHLDRFNSYAGTCYLSLLINLLHSLVTLSIQLWMMRLLNLLLCNPINFIIFPNQFYKPRKSKHESLHFSWQPNCNLLDVHESYYPSMILFQSFLKVWLRFLHELSRMYCFRKCCLVNFVIYMGWSGTLLIC